MDYGAKVGAPQLEGGQRDVVKNVLERQGSVLAALHEIITGLEGRLRIVLEPPPPPQAIEKTAPQTPTRLTHIIEQNSETIEAAIRRIHEIIERLEL